jgi:hypothetical protein
LFQTSLLAPVTPLPSRLTVSFTLGVLVAQQFHQGSASRSALALDGVLV